MQSSPKLEMCHNICLFISCLLRGMARQPCHVNWGLDCFNRQLELV